jgi:hypothetical protein
LRNSCLIFFAVATLASAQAIAWGDLGHRVTATQLLKAGLRMAAALNEALESKNLLMLRDP